MDVKLDLGFGGLRFFLTLVVEFIRTKKCTLSVL